MSIEIYQQATVLAIFIVLLAATYYDCKSSIIPIYLFPILAVIVVPLSIIHGQPLLIESLMGLLIGVGTFMFLALLFKGGGGDIIMMGILGWCLGIRGTLMLIFLASGIYTAVATVLICYCAFIKKEKNVLRKQYPFALFVLAGFMIGLLSGWLF